MAPAPWQANELTLAQAAQLAACSVTWLFREIKLGHLKACKRLRADRRGRQWVITREEVLAWVGRSGERRGRGRPARSLDMTVEDPATLVITARGTDAAKAVAALRELWRRCRCKLPLDADRLGIEYIEEEGSRDIRAKTGQASA